MFLETQTNQIHPIVSHMRLSMLAVVNFRGVCSRQIPTSRDTEREICVVNANCWHIDVEVIVAGRWFRDLRCEVEPVSKAQPSHESLEPNVDHDFRKQFELSVPLHEVGKWKCEFNRHY